MPFRARLNGTLDKSESVATRRAFSRSDAPYYTKPSVDRGLSSAAAA